MKARQAVSDDENHQQGSEYFLTAEPTHHAGDSRGLPDEEIVKQVASQTPDRHASGNQIDYGRHRVKTMHPKHELKIEYGDELLASLGLTRDEFNAEARFLLAAKLYELGRLTSGQAARLCGKGRVDFLHSLPRIGVSMSNLRPEDALSEVEFLQNG